jgi:hypothetical protein
LPYRAPSTQADTWGNVCSILYNAFVTNTCASIDNDVFSNLGSRIYDCSGNNNRASAYRDIRRNNGSRVNNGGQIKVSCANRRGQSQPRTAIPESKDQVSDTHSVKVSQLVFPAKDRGPTELCAVAHRVQIVKKTDDLVLTLQADNVGNYHRVP